MEKGLLTSVSLVALLFVVSCGAFKPDHPQVYKSFKDRRQPAENQIASTGELGKQEAKQEVRFRPYNGIAAPSQVAGKDQASEVASASSSKSSGPNWSTYQRQASSAVSSTAADSESLIDKIMRALNLKDSSSKNVASNEKRSPAGNTEMAAYSNQHIIAQGSANSYSYFEMADDIPAQETSEFGSVKTIPGSFDLAVDNSPTLPAPSPVVPQPAPLTPPAPQPAPPAPTPPAPIEPPKAPALPAPSVPSPHVPVEPSLDEMKRKIPEQPTPDLKTIPKVPHELEAKPADHHAAHPKPEAEKIEAKPTKAEKKVVKKSKKVKPKAKKAKHKKVVAKQPQPAPTSIPNADAIRDPSSSLEYIEGKPVVTGYLEE